MITPENEKRIADNLAEVQGRIDEAARASGRSADQIRLVAVTKYVGTAEVKALLKAGCNTLGESRPQQLWKKAEELADEDIAWHMIGHLQRNKLRRSLPLVDLIHSADSLRLLTAIHEQASQLKISVSTLLEVNVSQDREKHGFSLEEVERILPALAELPLIRVTGLMAMASRLGSLSDAEREFATLRKLRDKLQPNCPGHVSLTELSMGMSNDYSEAIRQGATIVRVGSALFAGVEAE